jgi:beta-barrel assembly-enhancing protease
MRTILSSCLLVKSVSLAVLCLGATFVPTQSSKAQNRNDPGQQLLQQLLQQPPANAPQRNQRQQAAPTPAPARQQATPAQGANNNLLNLLMNPNAPLPTAPAATPAPVVPAQAAGQMGNLMQMLSQSLDQIDQPKEIEIGRQLAAVLLGSKPLHPDMALQRYINRLGRWISLQSSRPDLPWTFAVLNDNGFNAFAAPGGYIFVTKGLVDRMTDEAELAGILAHEIVHVTEKHHLKAIRKNAQAGLITQLIGAQLNQSLGGGLSQQLIALGRDAYSKGLDQSDEYEADRHGVAMAARAGFDPYGLLAVLHQLRTVAADNGDFTLTLSTHPPAQLRLDQLEAAMGQRLDAFSGRRAVPLAQRLGR